MNNTTCISKTGLVTCLSLLLALSISGIVQGQNPFPCPPGANIRTTNPDFPGCKAPGGRSFNVLLVLDESGSINSAGATNTVRAAVNGFASILHSGTSGTGKIKMGVVEFSDVSQTGVPMTDVALGSFTTTVSSYMSSGYTANGPSTNYVAALTQAATFGDIDLIFFITDGQPFPTVPIPNWQSIANTIKCRGTYIFGIGVGTNTPALNLNIQALSGPDELNPPAVTLQNGADWTRRPFTELGPLLIDLANSLIDAQSPVVMCSPAIQVNNDPRNCFAKVNYSSSVTDNCPDATLSCTPASGSFFMVGQTTVTCRATDKVGNASTCTFRITVSDMEPPEIACPANVMVSCEVPLTPANTGSPTALDNCAIDRTFNTDVRVDGLCANTFSVTRTWTTVDIHFNMSTCVQVINVEDKKSPVITCPANITVECDTSVTKTGIATAIDNCTLRPAFSRSDAFVSGDCDWLCVLERTFVAKDECNNTSKCVQVITKDVTPLINTALGSSGLTFGQDQATVTIPAGKGNCVVQWLPYSGTIAKELPFDDAVAGADCRLATNPIDGSGHIVNPLLGEVMKLSILARLNPAFGTKKLSDFPCTIHFIVRQALKPNPDVNELLRVANLTLGNINFGTAEHKKFLLDALKCIGSGVTVCNVKP